MKSSALVRKRAQRLSPWDGEEDERWLLAGWSPQKWEELGMQVWAPSTRANGAGIGVTPAGSTRQL